MTRQKNPYLLTLPELISAKNKIGHVAGVYDPLKHPLSGFDANALNPTEFREQLRRNFGINLTDGEVGAIVTLFDEDDDRCVNSREFLNEFFKLGKEQQKKGRLKKEEREATVRSLHQKIAKQKIERLLKLAETKIAEHWTEEEEVSAMRKISKAAFKYSNVKGFLNEGTTILDAFVEPDHLTPVEFREQLKRNFELTLSAGESAALVKYFDDDGNGVIDAKEFMYNFFQLRRQEIDRHFRRQMKLTKKQGLEEQARLRERKEKYKKFADVLMLKATDEDKKSAFHKLRLAAAFNRPNIFIDAIRMSFESSDLTPAAFKEMLKNNFEIYLSPGELDAAVEMFDIDKDGEISCAEFMHTFYQMGLKEQSRRLKYKKWKDAFLENERKERLRLRYEKFTNKALTNVIWPALPPIDAESSTELGDSHQDVFGATTNSSSFNSTFSTTSTARSQGKRKKKATMSSLLNNEEAKRLAQVDHSLAALYPRASKDTKDFIMMIERHEDDINSITTTRRGTSRNLHDSSTVTINTDENYDIGEDSELQLSNYHMDNKTKKQSELTGDYTDNDRPVTSYSATSSGQFKGKNSSVPK